ncbi:hypothetical protein T06_13491 [Trichinella sp. T6]|nr:hypothetical protein T06_13491 [Trichinella sp. T6]
MIWPTVCGYCLRPIRDFRPPAPGRGRPDFPADSAYFFAKKLNFMIDIKKGGAVHVDAAQH